MTRVLLVAAASPARLGLEQLLPPMLAHGAEVDVLLAGDFRAALTDLPLREVHVLSPSGLPRRQRRGVARVRAALMTRYLRLVGRRLGAARAVWLRARRDPWVSAAASDSDVIVALDRLAVYPVWRLARRHRRCAAVHGLDAALRTLDGTAA